MEELKDLVGNIKKEWFSFAENANRQLDGNKAAGKRARKSSLELGKLMKEFRNLSNRAANE